MKRSVILIIVACLLTGAGLGYTAGYLRYEPQIKSYQIQVANLTAEVSSLEQTVANQKMRISTQTAQISTLESERSSLQQTVSGQKITISSLEQTVSSQETQISTQQTQIATQEARISAQTAQISTLESEKSRLQTDLSSAQAQAETYKGQVNTLTSQLSSSQKRLDNVLGITVTQFYQWQSWDWNLPIPLSLYVEYWERPRPQVWPNWVDMAKDAKDDYYIDQMVQKITDEASKNRFTEVQKINFVIGFVQGLPYTTDNVTTPYNEYPRYPIETLFDRGGDCEDTSILVAALLDRLGYDVALLFLKDAQHVAVGVAIPTASGSYYGYNGKKYYYLETTGEGWEIGEIPSSITNLQAYIYPLRS